MRRNDSIYSVQLLCYKAFEGSGAIHGKILRSVNMSNAYIIRIVSNTPESTLYILSSVENVYIVSFREIGEI